MTDYYNLTALNGTSGLLPIFNSIDANAGGWFGGAFLIFLFLVLLLSFRRSGNQDAFLASSAIVTLIAALGLGFGFVGGLALTFPVIALVFAVIAKVWGEG